MSFGMVKLAAFDSLLCLLSVFIFKLLSIFSKYHLPAKVVLIKAAIFAYHTVIAVVAALIAAHTLAIKNVAKMYLWHLKRSFLRSEYRAQS
jgi:hypothetical protein